MSHYHILLARKSCGGPHDGPQLRNRRGKEQRALQDMENSSTTQDGFGEKRYIRRGPPDTVSLYNASLFGRWGVAKTDPICPHEEIGQRFLGLGQKHRVALARKVVSNIPLFSPSSVVIGFPSCRFILIVPLTASEVEVARS